MTFGKRNLKAAKLTGEQVLEIRERYATGTVTYGELSREYGVSHNTISNVVHGVTWQHVARAGLMLEPDSTAAMQRIMARAAQLDEPVGTGLGRLAAETAKHAAVASAENVMVDELLDNQGDDNDSQD